MEEESKPPERNAPNGTSDTHARFDRLGEFLFKAFDSFLIPTA